MVTWCELGIGRALAGALYLELASGKPVCDKVPYICQALDKGASTTNLKCLVRPCRDIKDPSVSLVHRDTKNALFFILIYETLCSI